MAVQTRKCKECGKLFVPKGREIYCSEVHYRPCPSCGTLLEAKYLSDPARLCKACRHTRRKVEVAAPEKVEVKPEVKKPTAKKDKSAKIVKDSKTTKSENNETKKTSAKKITSDKPKSSANKVSTKKSTIKKSDKSEKESSLSNRSNIKYKTIFNIGIDMKAKSPEKPIEELEWRGKVDMIEAKTVDSLTFCEAVNETLLVYIGKYFNNGFIPGHEYLIRVEKADYVYNVTAIFDASTGEDCNILVPFASQISFYQNFAKRREAIAN